MAGLEKKKSKGKKEREWYWRVWKPDWEYAEKDWRLFKKYLNPTMKQMEDALKDKNFKKARHAVCCLQSHLHSLECNITPPY